jgi:plastocyanin
MKTSSIVIIVIAILVILGGWYAYATYYAPTAAPSTNTNINIAPNEQNNNPSGTPGTQSTSTATSSNAGVSADINAGVTTGSVPTSATVTLTANGFSPKSVTIKKGGTITWKNSGTGSMWVASAQHPTHTAYDGTTLAQHCPSGDSFDQCKNGTTYSFAFDQAGSWNYHNHSNTSQFGTIIVVE